MERGELERRVLEVLRDDGESTVRRVVERLDSGRAYTTILTVLDRLHAKGEVRRRKIDGAWCYVAATSREEAAAEQIATLLASGGGTDAFLMAFVERAESVDAELLDKLEKVIQERRARR